MADMTRSMSGREPGLNIGTSLRVLVEECELPLVGVEAPPVLHVERHGGRVRHHLRRGHEHVVRHARLKLDSLRDNTGKIFFFLKLPNNTE